MAREVKTKECVNTRLATNYGGWMYCDTCNENIGYLCYSTYDRLELTYQCSCGSHGSVILDFIDSKMGEVCDEELVMVKNRLCCPKEGEPLITILDKKVVSYEMKIVCKSCQSIYRKEKNLYKEVKSVELEQLSLEELWDLFPITLVDNQEKYKEQYRQEEQYLKTILKAYIKRISHIGSTSISNIKTKPIVDILLEVETKSAIKKVKEILISHHYILMGEDWNSLRISLNKGYTSKGYAREVFHIHIRKYKDCDELYFRDYLNENLKIAKEYEKLKLDLYEKYSPNRDLYTKGKTDFVVRIVQVSKQKYPNRY